MDQPLTKRSVFGKRASALALLLACGQLVLAQSNSGNVTGTIIDASGAAIQAAVVTATNEATNVKVTATANSAGSYQFANLPVGAYTITAEAKGFSPSGLKNIAVDLNKTVTANLTLAVGSASVVVEVTDATAVIDTTTAQLQNTFTSNELTNLPSAGANGGGGVYNLTLLGAGVASSGGVGQGFGPSISGQRPDNNVFTIDGVSNQNHYNPAPLVYVGNDAVAELSCFRISLILNSAAARGVSLTPSLRRAATTSTALFMSTCRIRNLNAVDATDWVQGLTSLPRYDNNRLGANIGGPILKNKLFYFGDFEYNPLGQSATPGSPLEAPTAAGYTALGSVASTLSKNNLAALSRNTPVPRPLMTLASSLFQASKFQLAPSLPFPRAFTNTYDAVVAIDYNMSEKDQLRGRWIYNRVNSIDTGAQLADL